MKICKKCIYCSFNNDTPEYSKCKNPVDAEYSAITGELVETYCESERKFAANGKKCGAEAINFSPIV